MFQKGRDRERKNEDEGGSRNKEGGKKFLELMNLYGIDCGKD